MGLPALKHESPSGRARPHLVPVVAGPPSRSQRTSRGTQTSVVVRHRELFTAFAIGALLLSALGVARIAVSARAAATSIESAQLRKAIKAERLTGDRLEIQQSVLTTPGRIQEIAGSTMSMSEAGRVCYIQLDGTEKCVPSSAKTPASPGREPSTGVSEGRAGLISTVLRAALGEAQLLLLGDVALASSR